MLTPSSGQQVKMKEQGCTSRVRCKRQLTHDHAVVYASKDSAVREKCDGNPRPTGTTTSPDEREAPARPHAISQRPPQARPACKTRPVTRKRLLSRSCDMRGHAGKRKRRVRVARPTGQPCRTRRHWSAPCTAHATQTLTGRKCPQAWSWPNHWLNGIRNVRSFQCMGTS